MWTKKFWKATTERVVASFAGAIAALWGSDMFNILEADLEASLGIGLGAGAVALLKALAAPKLTGTPGPSFSRSEQTIEDSIKETIEDSIEEVDGNHERSED